MTNLDDARRAYEAAKVIQHCVSIRDYERIKTTYEAALLADAQATLDAMGVVIGETEVTFEGVVCGSIHKLEADVAAGRVRVWTDKLTGFVWADEIRPYGAPVAKEMVLWGDGLDHWTKDKFPVDRFRLTLSGITPADLDGMTGPITGTYTVEKL